MRMRALDRWSAVSLATTTPSPVQGDPRRPLFARLLSGIAGLLEIAGVDLVEARGGEIDAGDRNLGAEPARDLGPQIALAIDPVSPTVLPGAERLHPHDAGNRGEALRDAGSTRLDIDNMAAAEPPAGQLGHGARQRDAAAVEQRDAVAHALHLVEVVRG